MTLEGIAQTVTEQKISLSHQNQTIETILFSLIDDANIPLSFSSEILPNKKVTIEVKNETITVILDKLLQGTTIDYNFIANQIVLFKKKPRRKFTISGFLEDAETGERLIGASVFDRISYTGTTSNEYGFYSLTLPAGETEIGFSYLGYQSQLRQVNLRSDYTIHLALKSSVTLTEVLVISNDSLTEGSDRGASTHSINVSDIEHLPTLVGESDLIRTTQLFPGVQTGTDGVGGVYVRGGNASHNLIMIDGVPVYNVAHAAGIFSIFNTSAVRSAKLLKGGFPARYGGRLSSVLDVRTKEGNKKELKGRLDVGLVTSRLTLEGPIEKDKSSYFISGRLSYLDWYLKPYTMGLKEDNGEIGFTSYNFYDLNAKINYALSEKDRIYLSFYGGGDDFLDHGSSFNNFSIQTNEGVQLYRYKGSRSDAINWGNKVGAFRWNHLFGKKLFANATATYSRLDVNLNYLNSDSLKLLDTGDLELGLLDVGRYQSSIEDIGGKIDFDWIPSTAHYFRFGAEFTRHLFKPGALVYDESSADANDGGEISNAPINSSEYVVYVEDEMNVNAALTLNLGLRATNLNVHGQNYFSFQPRASLYWQANANLGFKASYSEMTQYLHLLSNSRIGLPTDLWVPSTHNIKPQQSWQVVGGVDLKLGKAYHLSLEGYYKDMDNLLSYSEGAIFLNDWEENVTSGEGRAYGMEMFLQKTKGKTTGWLAYSLSWSDRQFENINFGRRFPFRYDRRHDLKLAVRHEFNTWFEMTANWVLSSGFMFNLPISKYYFPISDGSEVVPVIDYEEKNNRRMPIYHRLDIGFNFRINGPRIKHKISVGAYNLYNRSNPLYYDLKTTYLNENNRIVEEKQRVGVFLFPILPSLNYSLKF